MNQRVMRTLDYMQHGRCVLIAFLELLGKHGRMCVNAPGEGDNALSIGQYHITYNMWLKSPFS